jgi:hypothetical protein
MVEGCPRTLIAFEKVVTNLDVEGIDQQHVRNFRDRLMLVGTHWCSFKGAGDH